MIESPSAGSYWGTAMVAEPLDVETARALGNSLPEGMVVTSSSGTIVFANIAFGDLVGREPAQLIGEQFDSLIPENRRAAHRAAMQEYFSNEPARSERAAEVQLVRADGRILHVEIALSPWSMGDKVGALGIIRDKTGDYELLERHAEQQRHFSIVASVAEALSKSGDDPTKVFETATRELADAIGDACVLSLVDETREHLVPTVFHHCDPRGEQALREVYLRASVELGQGLAGEVALTGNSARVSGIPTEQLRQLVRPDYQSYLDQFETSSILIVPLMDGTHPIGTLGLSRQAPYTDSDEALLQDLASRITLALTKARLAQELSDKYERLSTIADNLPAMVGYWDRDLRNEFANDAYTLYFGMTPDEIKGKHISDVLGPDLFQLNVGYMHAALAGQAQHFEREIVDPNGAKHYTNASYIPHVVNGATVGFFVLVTDVTELVLANRAAEESEQKFRVLAENASDAVWRLTMEGLVDWVSPSIYALSGRGSNELIGSPLDHWFHPDDQSQVREQLGITRDTGAAVTLEARLATEHDQYRWVSLQARLWRSAQGESPEIIVGMRDAQHAVESRQLLEQNERLLRLTIEQAPQGTAVLGYSFEFIRVNEALCDVLERDREWLLTHSLVDVLTESEVATLQEQADLLYSGAEQDVDYEMRVVLPSGGEAWLRHAMTLLTDDGHGPSFFVSQIEDVTVARRRRRQLEYRARHDPLTGLLNRDALNHELVRIEVERGGDFAVLFCDLDSFKAINDNYGHHTGDDVLSAVASRLQSCVRRSDVVARLGGDEFVVILTEINKAQDCERVAHTIHRVVSTPIHTEAATITPTITIGVSLASADADPTQVVASADKALYKAKRVARGMTRLVDLRTVPNESQDHIH